MCKCRLSNFEVRIISCGLVELAGHVNDRIAIEIIHGGHKAILELLFGGDADVPRAERASFEKTLSTRLSHKP
jgi:hypothetical protein